MALHPFVTRSWPPRGGSIALAAVLLSVLAHGLVIGWASALLRRPQVLWVQPPLPLTLETPTVRSAQALQAARPKPVTPAIPPRATPPSVPTPSPSAADAPAQRGPEPDPATAPIDTPAPPSTPPLALESSLQPSAPPPVQPAETGPTEPSTASADSGPLGLLGQPAQLPLVPMTLHYKVYGSVNTLTYQASSSLRFEPQAASGYSVTYKVGAFLLGKRQQVSLGQMGASGLEPRQFTDQSRRTQVTQVQVETQTVKLPGNPTEQAWTPGTQDRLSVFVQLGAWVAAAPAAFEQGQSFRVPVWSSRETETWWVVSQGKERLPTPYGEHEAIRLARMPLNPNDARVDMWFVPAWGALPVRIEMVEANGNRAEQTLNEIEPAPPARSP